MKIVNYTPHVINIAQGADYDNKQRKFIANNEFRVVKSIEPCGTLLNAQQSNVDAESIEEVPTKTTTFAGVVEAPKDCWCIVSAMYVAACKQLGKDTSNLLKIGDAVYDAVSIKPIGALNLIRN